MFSAWASQYSLSTGSTKSGPILPPLAWEVASGRRRSMAPFTWRIWPSETPSTSGRGSWTVAMNLYSLLKGTSLMIGWLARTLLWSTPAKYAARTIAISVGLPSSPSRPPSTPSSEWEQRIPVARAARTKLVSGDWPLAMSDSSLACEATGISEAASAGTSAASADSSTEEPGATAPSFFSSSPFDSSPSSFFTSLRLCAMNLSSRTKLVATRSEALVSTLKRPFEVTNAIMDMRFMVSVPVLSEQITVTEPRVSTAGSTRTIALCVAMLLTAQA
mmetsp:Transcript_868/g.1303  ORF Transcript_868/g.1303 Transcript_868/m.1303 type:complete len:275 (+) Transcript_868:1581-2405(+)